MTPYLTPGEVIGWTLALIGTAVLVWCVCRVIGRGS